jgi:hypothetical protein
MGKSETNAKPPITANDMPTHEDFPPMPQSDSNPDDLPF